MSTRYFSFCMGGAAAALLLPASLIGCNGADAVGDPVAAPPQSASLHGLAKGGGGSSGSGETLDEVNDDDGQIESDSLNGFGVGGTNGFFASLGTNGRTCNTCHAEGNGWSITPAHARALAVDDPLFTPNDGSDCPPTSPPQAPNRSLSSELTDYGLVRVQLSIPEGAGFSLASSTNPKGCAIPPGSSAIGGQLFLFRRPLPSTNLVFDSALMWDGRETLQKITTAANETSEDPLLFDLADQANSATVGHAQGAAIAGTPAQADIVTFEANMYTGQSLMQRQHILLDADGANGGAQYIADVLAPNFFIGINDPLAAGFTNADFTIYQAWEPTSPSYAKLKKDEQAIGRGEAIFNGTTFVIHDVPGLNSFPGNPLYNPADPLAGHDIQGGCAVCHNSPNIGNHSTSLPINIGVTMAQPVNSDGSPNTVLDVGHLPVYTLTSGDGHATVSVTDPGRALVSGRWVDIGKTKGPILRGLGSRAPYFHNGSAADLATVVAFYNARFAIGLTADQASDLVAFLRAL
jgi:hypothetical protein